MQSVLLTHPYRYIFNSFQHVMGSFVIVNDVTCVNSTVLIINNIVCKRLMKLHILQPI